MVNLLRHKQRTVPVAQETEVVTKGVIINLAPVTFDKSRHEQQQCTLGLVEIGDDTLHNMERVAWRYHNLRIGVERR